MNTVIKFLYLISLATISSCLNNWSTKTAYMHSFNSKQLKFIQNPQNYRLENCEPKQIYIVLRHGSRNPNGKHITKSGEFLEKVKSFRSKQRRDTTSLDEIFYSFKDVTPYELTNLGQEEMNGIAERYKQRFPILFKKENLDIMSSFKDRSIKSAHSFIKGLFPSENDANDVIEKIYVNNRIMRLFEECSRYVVGVKQNETALNEFFSFKNGNHITELLEGLKTRHDIKELDSLDSGLLFNLFTLCNIEQAHEMELNWCKLFIDSDYPIMSYLNDLKGYWMKSYGNKINSKMTFSIIQDLFKEMENSIQNEAKFTALLRFGHAENIFPLVTELGLFKDPEPLMANNFKQHLNRKFKSSFLTPFASNVAFVLNKCGQNDFKISLYVNELPVRQLNAGKLACVSDDDLNETTCDYHDLKSQLSDSLGSSFDELCQKKFEAKDKIKLEL